jgi:DNA-binding NarL/FixJ family response regulator
VLIVDDQPVFRRAAHELLEARGYAVVGEAGCAAAALQAAKQLEPDAVLLDVRLGDESGHEVARALTRFAPARRCCLSPSRTTGTATSTPGRAELVGSCSWAGSR